VLTLRREGTGRRAHTGNQAFALPASRINKFQLEKCGINPILHQERMQVQKSVVFLVIGLCRHVAFGTEPEVMKFKVSSATESIPIQVYEGSEPIGEKGKNINVVIPNDIEKTVMVTITLSFGPKIGANSTDEDSGIQLGIQHQQEHSSATTELGQNEVLESFMKHQPHSLSKLVGNPQDSFLDLNGNEFTTTEFHARTISETPNSVTRIPADGSAKEILATPPPSSESQELECTCREKKSGEKGGGGVTGQEIKVGQAEPEVSNTIGQGANAIKNLVVQSVTVVGTNLAGVAIMGFVLGRKIQNLKQNLDEERKGFVFFKKKSNLS